MFQFVPLHKEVRLVGLEGSFGSRRCSRKERTPLLQRFVGFGLDEDVPELFLPDQIPPTQPLSTVLGECVQFGFPSRQDSVELLKWPSVLEDLPHISEALLLLACGLVRKLKGIVWCCSSRGSSPPAVCGRLGRAPPTPPPLGRCGAPVRSKRDRFGAWCFHGVGRSQATRNGGCGMIQGMVDGHTLDSLT